MNLLRFFRAAPPPAEASVLMVCLGNLCRSPTAEAVLRTQLERAGLDRRVRVASAGTHSERGSAPDPRAVAAAARRGYDLSGLRSRRVDAAELAAFDLIIGMDRTNVEFLQSAAPPDVRDRVRLLLAGEGQDIPDPYYGAAAGFEHVLDLIEAGCDNLVQDLRRRLGTS